MKYLNRSMILALSLSALTTSAQASTSSYQNLEDIALSFNSDLANGGEQDQCTYHAKKVKDGLTIEASNHTLGTISFTILKYDDLATTSQESSDGSFVTEFKTDSGSVQFTHVDDAYDELEVTVGSKTIECGVYY